MIAPGTRSDLFHAFSPLIEPLDPQAERVQTSPKTSDAFRPEVLRFLRLIP